MKDSIKHMSSKKSKKNTKSETTDLITLNKVEKWDFIMVNNLLKLRDLPYEDSLHLLSIKDNLVKRYLPVVVSSHERGWGRRYSNIGYQRLERGLRNLLAHQLYVDIDIVNANYTILLNLCQMNQIQCTQINAYIQNRDAIYKLGDKNTIKQAFLSILNGGNNVCPVSQPEAILFFDALKTEIKIVRQELWNLIHYNDVQKAAITETDLEYATDKTISVEQLIELKHRKFFSLLIQKYEDIICNAMDTFFTQNGWKVGVLVFDGIMVELFDDKTGECIVEHLPHLLRDCEKYILEKHKFHIHLIQKSLEPSEKDWDFYHGYRDSTCNPLSYLIDRLVYKASLDHAMRTDEYILLPHPTIRGVYLQSELHIEYVNRLLSGDSVYNSRSFTKEIGEYLATVDNDKFKLLDPTRTNINIIAFLNGYFDINTLLFYDYDQYIHKFKQEPITFHYFEVNYDDALLSMDTPTWDLICNTQWDRDGCEFFEFSVGRLFYPVCSFDNFEYMLYLKGDGGTGKSTLITTITSMFPVNTVSVISADHEKTFGLDGMESKRLVVFADMPIKMSNILPQATWQSMQTGEQIAINRKFKKKMTVKWSVPSFGAGNHYPDYPDTAGSVSRRFVVWPCNNPITNRDTGLARKIKNEIPTILIRCLKAYRNFVSQHPDCDIWKFIPTILSDMKDDVQAETNDLANFLINGDNYYQILHVPNVHTSLQDFIPVFQNHLKFTAQKPYKRITDYAPFHQQGFKVEKTNICKSCGNVAKTGCCNHYSLKNRKKNIVIKGLSILNLKQSKTITISKII